jgi:hypothetical protein
MPLWDTMKTTSFGRALPRELMPNPQIYAAESDSWSYRFSLCHTLQQLLDMRMHARRQSGILWCCHPNGRIAKELQMLLYAGGCKLPVVVLVSDIKEGTDASDRFEMETRAFLEQTGAAADDALFIYAKQTPKETLLHLYQRLDDALSAPPEAHVPPLHVKSDSFEFLLTLDKHLPEPLSAISRLQVQFGRKQFGFVQQEETTQITILRQLSKENFHAIAVRAEFDKTLAFQPEQTFTATVHLPNGQTLQANPCVLFV